MSLADEAVPADFDAPYLGAKSKGEKKTDSGK